MVRRCRGHRFRYAAGGSRRRCPRPGCSHPCAAPATVLKTIRRTVPVLYRLPCLPSSHDETRSRSPRHRRARPGHRHRPCRRPAGDCAAGWRYPCRHGHAQSRARHVRRHLPGSDCDRPGRCTDAAALVRPGHRSGTATAGERSVPVALGRPRSAPRRPDAVAVAIPGPDRAGDPDDARRPALAHHGARGWRPARLARRGRCRR
ncbi:hypothetical protein D3C81_1462120 [compost metagenome]